MLKGRDRARATERSARDADEGRVRIMLEDPRQSLIWSGALFAAAMVLYAMVWSTTARSWLQGVDDRWLSFMQHLQTPVFVDLGKVLAFVGAGIVTWTIRALVIGILLFRRHWLHLSAFVLSVVTSEMFIGPSKALLDRPRPPGALIATSGASFPSGHAIGAATTGVGLVIALLPPGHTRWVWERWAAFYASLMALSRTYLAAHWLSDVVAGALLGSAIAIFWPALLVTLRIRSEARHGKLPAAGADGADP
jgi:undecaprenyl-diphosphatase